MTEVLSSPHTILLSNVIKDSFENGRDAAVNIHTLDPVSEYEVVAEHFVAGHTLSTSRHIRAALYLASGDLKANPRCTFFAYHDTERKAVVYGLALAAETNHAPEQT